jgi:hypothetical protein
VVAIAIATRPFKYHENSVTNTTSSFVFSIHSFAYTTYLSRERTIYLCRQQHIHNTILSAIEKQPNRNGVWIPFMIQAVNTKYTVHYVESAPNYDAKPIFIEVWIF